MRKKKIALLFWFIVLAVAISLGVLHVEEMSKRWYKRVEIDEYGLSISYPRGYVDIPKKVENIEQIANNITATLIESKEPIAVDLVDEIINARSDVTGLTIYAEAIKKDKTPKTIEQICKDYIIMFKIFNSYEEVVIEKYEETTVAGVPAGRTEIYVKGEWDFVYPGMVSYLIPLEDREITIVFSGTKTLIERSEKEINKIINSVKFYECEEEIVSGDAN